MKPIENGHSLEDSQKKQAELKAFTDMDREAGEPIGEEFRGLVSEEKLAKIRTVSEQLADPEKLKTGHLTEHTEAERLENAVEHISKIEQLRPEVWSGLSDTKREWALRQVGQRMSEAYECPAPPFISGRFTEDGKSITYGEHSDFNYIIKLNRDEVLKMDDPAKALETYCHEFRHAYQHEMAGRYDSAYMQEFRHSLDKHEITGLYNSPLHQLEAAGLDKSTFRHLCHNESQAKLWAENLNPRNYIRPEEDLKRYAEQPVENDARDFAAKIKEELRRRGMSLE
jgi:uncharacterized protein YeaO (DUF488 family)